MATNRPDDPSAARLTTTIWTAVAQTGDRNAPEGRQALTELCREYWYPIYASVRRRGHSAHEAEDLTQGFFADLLARGSLKRVDPATGTFWSFLLAALQHFLSNQRDHDRRLKRGGKIPHLSLDFHDAESRYQREPGHADTAERLFQRRWALTLLARVLEGL